MYIRERVIYIRGRRAEAQGELRMDWTVRTLLIYGVVPLGAARFVRRAAWRSRVAMYTSRSVLKRPDLESQSELSEHARWGG